MASRKRPLAEISTQYARNGPLIEESLEYLRLVASSVARTRRRELLVVENGLRRQTYKARRNIFEALEARFNDERRATHLGLLTFVSVPSRALSLGVLLETARFDRLVGEFLEFIVGHLGMSWSSIDAKRFLHVLDQQTGAVGRWAPTLQKRAVSSLNALPARFQIWERRDGSSVPPIELPPELGGIIIQERLMDRKSPLQAPEFQALGMERKAILDIMWTCARRNWFNVDAVGDVVRVEPCFGDVASMLGLHHLNGVCA